ncbi:MAG TPA: GNAT family acetyltransferase [Pseudolysinimonas sp.]|nr:GNAT family acetyltransferase [Pseudolysinimonas sp.]
MALDIRPFEAADEDAVVALWEECGLVRPWNDPRRDIARKLTVQRDLFLVAVDGDAIVGVGMAGFDGHRGWVNYLAVMPGRRQAGIGTALMDAFEERLLALGCPKVNLQVRSGNDDVLAFYARLGYTQDAAVSLGKRLISDD